MISSSIYSHTNGNFFLLNERLIAVAKSIDGRSFALKYETILDSKRGGTKFIVSRSRFFSVDLADYPALKHLKDQVIESRRYLPSEKKSMPKTSIVIANAGFAGEKATWLLHEIFFPEIWSDRPDIHIALIARTASVLNITELINKVFKKKKKAIHREPQAFKSFSASRQSKRPLSFEIKRRPATKKLEDYLIAEPILAINPATNTLLLSSGAHTYDYLLLGIGSLEHLPSIPGASSHAFQLKNHDDAMKLKNHLHSCIKKATIETDPVKRKALLTFVVVGNDYSGAQLMSELIKHCKQLVKHHPTLSTALDFVLVNLPSTEIELVSLSQDGPLAIERYLKQLTVTIQQERPVKITPEAIIFENKVIPTHTVIWQLIEPMPSYLSSLVTYDSKIFINEHLQVIGYPNVYLIGDKNFGLLPDSSRPIREQLTASATEHSSHLAVQHLINAMGTYRQVPTDKSHVPEHLRPQTGGNSRY